jgi:hypothetical protein
MGIPVSFQLGLNSIAIIVISGHKLILVKGFCIEVVALEKEVDFLSAIIHCQTRIDLRRHGVLRPDAWKVLFTYP